MTVCVAAVANNGMIICASDRMLSNFEFAFEPPLEKRHAFTTAVHLLWSGDPATIAMVVAAVQADVNALVAYDPDRWLSVEQIVNLYVSHWNALRRRRAENDILAPLGLTIDAFMNRQQQFQPLFVDNVTKSLVAYQVPYSAVIIAGQDDTGSHIWLIENGQAKCEDVAGFAAIGTGARHALSQMMVGLHTPARTPSETLVLVHLSKRRAETTPSVGRDTDVLLIGPYRGQHAPLAEQYKVQLDRDYRRLKKAEERALRKANLGFDAYVMRAADAQRNAEQVVAGTAPAESVHA